MRIHKEIPRSGASLEARRDARNERAEMYPSIEVNPDIGSLSAADDEPTDEDLWGDPVNLVYPLAGPDDDEPDRDRAANARSRFKQFATDQYSSPTSLATVHERIVSAEIDAGAFPAFDADDPLDVMLPDELQEQMRKNVMTLLDKAIDRARTRILPDTESKPGTLESIVRELGSIRTGLVDVRPELAKRITGVAYTLVGAINKEFEGDPLDPAEFGLPFLDVSTDPNFAPVEVPLVTRDDQNQIRALDNPLAEPDMVTVNDDQIQRTGPSPDPAYPPARVPETNVDPNTPIRIPEPPAPVGVPWEPAGVSKAQRDSLPFGQDY